MYNPTYLIKSRHDVYYFRYPLPVQYHGKTNRVSVSLGTRSPKLALQLAKMLEYHSMTLIQELDCYNMDYAELTAIFKDHFAKLLNVKKQTMDEFGPLSKAEASKLERSITLMDTMIDEEVESLPVLDDSMDKSIMNISKLYGLGIEPNSDEYDLAKKQYRYVLKSLFKDILSYNKHITDYSMLDTPDKVLAAKQSVNRKPSHQLQTVINKYVAELEGKQKPDSLKDKKDCLECLIELLGIECPIGSIDGDKAREVKEQLMRLPYHRNKKKETKDKPVLKQIEICQRESMKKISDSTVNKYLTHYSGLFSWAKRSKYIQENPFEGMYVEVNKKKNRRDKLNKDEVQLILSEVLKGKGGIAKDTSKYWGTLLAVYTGARRNEIASLLPEDIKQDTRTGIWYIQIEDEEEAGKSVKSEAANRIVPIHSRLIDLGFLDYVKEAKRVTEKMPDLKGYRPRLLYSMTPTDSGKWGRKLGQFVNETLLPKLGIHVPNKKTLHSLRHSFITYLSVAKVDHVTIKSMAGHEQGTVTERIYTHYGIEHLPAFREAIEKLGY